MSPPPPKKSFIFSYVYLRYPPSILEGQELLIWLWMYFMRHDCDEVGEATDKGKRHEEGLLKFEALWVAYLG